MHVVSVEIPRLRDGTPILREPVEGAELVVLLPDHTVAWRVPTLHDVWLDLEDLRLPRILGAAPPIVEARVGLPLVDIKARAAEQGGLESSAAAWIALELFEAFEHLHARELAIAAAFERHTLVGVDGDVQLFAPIERNQMTNAPWHVAGDIPIEAVEEALGAPVSVLDTRWRTEALRVQLALLGQWLVDAVGGTVSLGRATLPAHVPLGVDTALRAGVEGRPARMRTELRQLARGDGGRALLRSIVAQLFPDERDALAEWREQVAMLCV